MYLLHGTSVCRNTLFFYPETKLTPEQEAKKRRLTSTSYTILGYLAVSEFSTFGLANQVRRAAQHFWPRAKSSLYDEPKRLLEDGYADARIESVGERRRTVYSITDKGRKALEGWLGQPPAPTRIESEMLIKMIFAPYGSKADLLNNLHEYRQQLAAREEELLAIFRQYVNGDDPFPERVHANVVVFKLIWDYAQVETRWVDWALEVVDGWPDTVGPHNRADLVAELEEIIRTAGDRD